MQKFVCAVSLVVLIVCGGCRNPWMENVLINLYHIGDKGPGGGIIFYRSENGFKDTYSGKTHHFLEVAPTDFVSLGWAIGGPAFDDVLGARGTAIGTGRANTQAILSVADEPDEVPAASVCKNYLAGGKNDWFLPSIDELLALYKSGLSIGSNFYWSSSDYCENNNALFCNFIYGTHNDSYKTTGYYVRAVRSF